MSTIYRHARHDAVAMVAGMQNGIIVMQSDHSKTPNHGTVNDRSKELQEQEMHAVIGYCTMALH